MRLSMFIRLTFELTIAVTERLLSEWHEGGLRCATGKPEKFFQIQQMCSVIISANQQPVSSIYE